MKLNELNKKLQEKGDKISKARKVRSLIQKQKGLLRSKQSLTDFKEPVLFLQRRSGIVDIFESATAGKFTFEHSNGKARFIELRPSDQGSFPYADKRVRMYIAHEDRPFAGWDDPLVDSESVMLGYEKTKATDLKYQERIEALKVKGKKAWVGIAIGIAIALAIIGFAYSNWIQPALEKRAVSQAVIDTAGPTAGILLLSFKNWWKRRWD